MATREEIIAKLDKERDRLYERYRALPPEDLTRLCTQSEVPGGAPWSAKDHLAHLAMIERAFQGMIHRTLEGTSNPVGFDISRGRDAVIARVHQGNQDNVEEHRDDDLETLLADMDEARIETRRLLDTLTDEQLAAPVPGAPWMDGTIGGVLHTNAHHAVMHWNWVEEGLTAAAGGSGGAAPGAERPRSTGSARERARLEMTYSELTYETTNHVGVITLNRPEARNALTHTTYAELEDAVRTTTARCLVITGADPAFCSGDDVKQVMVAAGKQTADRLQAEPRLTPAASALLGSDVPIIAAVNGAAVGWGMELALMADIRIASELARFGELFVKRGLCCDVPGIGRLAQLVGREQAAELLFTGRIIDAGRAHELGLVSRVVPHAELLPTALELAEEIASNPPLAVQRMKQGLRQALDPDWDDLGRWVSASLGELFRTEDHKEGVASFLEKREPKFVGR